MRFFLGAMSAAVMAAGCGSTVLTENASGTTSGASTAGAGGASSSAGPGGSSSSVGPGGTGGTGAGGAGAGTCVSLGVGSMQILTNPTSDDIESIAATPVGVLLGLRHFDAADNAVWSVQRLAFDGASVGPRETLASWHSNQSTGPIELAAGPMSAAATLWDLDHGCSFVPLGFDGTPTGMPVPTGFLWCQNLLATGAGFSFFAGASGPTVSLVTVDAGGSILAKQPMPQMNGLELRVGLPDESFVATWSTEGVECADCPLHVEAQHFSSSGKALGPNQPIFGDGTFGLVSDLDHVALAPTTSGLLAGWSSTNPSSSDAGAFYVVAFAADAVQPSSTQTVVPPSGHALEGIALAEVAGGDVVAAWLATDGSNDSTVFARTLSPAGVPYSAAIQVMSGPVAGGFTAARMVATPNGAIVVGQAGGLAAAAALTCIP